MTEAKITNEILKGLQKNWNSTKTEVPFAHKVDVNARNKLGIRSIVISPYPSKTQQTTVQINLSHFIAIIAVLALIIMLKQGRVKTCIKLLTQPKEKILFLTGIATLLELLYPPRIFRGKYFLGFHPIWKTSLNRWYVDVPVDCSLLIIEVIVTTFIGLSIYLLAKSQKEKTR